MLIFGLLVFLVVYSIVATVILNESYKGEDAVMAGVVAAIVTVVMSFLHFIAF